jgi:hypothetical protein
MKRLIINGDPGVRRDGVIEYDGEEYTCFQVTRNGDYHGPDRVQLWCVVGDEDEYETYARQEFVPHFLDVELIDAEAVTVIKRAGDLAV